LGQAPRGLLDVVLQLVTPVVKPWDLLGRAETPDGTDLTLMLRDREYVIFADGKPLMSSRMHGSEEALASLGCRMARAVVRPSVLVGGLGMGFTLRAALDLLPADASVVVAELLPAVVEWNRGPLGHLAGHPLKDRRVSIEVGDVAQTIASSSRRFDAILLDVDNGPRPFTSSQNVGLYDGRGLARIRAALKPGATLAVWSAWDDRKFVQRLRYEQFSVIVERVRARLAKGGPKHVIFVAHASG
jgi:spermidine synthase